MLKALFRKRAAPDSPDGGVGPFATTHPFSSDRPIETADADALDRGPFARALAQAIARWSGDDSLVLALYGPWGSGKSSIKNLVLEALRRETPDQRPEVLEFTPWQFAGQEQIAQAFFREVGIRLGRKDPTGKARRLAVRWRLYTARLTIGAAVISSLRRAYPIVLGVLGLAGFGFATVGLTGFDVGVLADALTWRGVLITASLVVLLGVVLEACTGVTKAVAEAYTAWAEASTATVAELKGELTQLLRRRERPLLVVMDDVDRLTPPDLLLLFQLVKANADLPRMVYLLLFSRAQVERGIQVATGMPGRRFLEKIVQVGFDIPTIDRPRLERVLFRGLDDLLAGKGVAARFDRYHWGNVYREGLEHYFRSLRDVKRFLSTLTFHVGVFQNEDAFEVNPVDLIAIEALRVFEPGVYRRLAANKVLLTTGEAGRPGARDAEAQARAAADAIVAAAPEARRPAVRNIVRTLFPPVEWVWGGSRYGEGFEDEWIRDLRVCTKDVFDRYFQLSVPEGDVAQAVVDRLLALAGDRAGLAAELGRLAEQGRLGPVLVRLHAYREQIAVAHVVSFVTALLDVGDDLPEAPVGPADLGAEMYVKWIIFGAIGKEKDQTQRQRAMAEAVRQTTGLFLPTMLVALDSDRANREPESGDDRFPRNALPELRALCVERIRAAAADGRLAANPRFRYLLRYWQEWADPEEARAWASTWIQTPEGAVAFLKGCLDYTTVSFAGDRIARQRCYIDLQPIEAVVRLEALQAQIERVSLEGLDAKAARAVRAFRAALDARRSGAEPDLFGRPGSIED